MVDLVDFVLFDNFFIVTGGVDGVARIARERSSWAVEVGGVAIDKRYGSSSLSELDIVFSNEKKNVHYIVKFFKWFTSHLKKQT